MKIFVTEHPNCTWKLDSDTFFCTHDEYTIVQHVEDYLGFDGHHQVESMGYECAECGEPLDGNPEEFLDEY